MFSHPPSRILLALLAFIVPLASLWAQDDIGATPLRNETDPQVAYNSVDDEFLIIYRNNLGDIIGEIRDGYWNVVDDYIRLLPSGTTSSYSHARVTFKRSTTQSYYVITAIFQENSGSLPYQQLLVAGFNPSGSRQWTRPLRATPNETHTPDVVADNFASNCCLIVSWEEGRGQLYTQVMNADGSLRGSRARINTGEGYRPALTYQRQNDRFLVAYKRKSGRSELVSQLVSINNVASTAQVVSTLTENPRTSSGQRYSTAAAAAYNFSSNRSTLAWFDGGVVYGQHLNLDGRPSGSRISLFDGTSWFLNATTATPTMAAVPGSTEMIAAFSSSQWTFWPTSGTTYYFSGRLINGTTHSYLPITSGVEGTYGGVVEMSPVSGYYVGIWEENESAGTSGGNHDILGIEYALP